MLAPTRDLVAELNTRARHQRLNGTPAGREVWLSDGLPASAGDTILTRRNNRRLRTSATDFVKNGDRWQVVDATRMVPRAGLVRIATGRDAADTAFLTVLSGQVTFGPVQVTCYAHDGLLPEDPSQPVHL